MRVLRVYHSAVVEQYRQRERLLQKRHGHDIHLVCPPAWHEGGSLVPASVDPEVNTHIVPVRGRQHPILFWYDTRALRRIIRSLRPDVVDLHEEPYSLASAAALRVVNAEMPRVPVTMYTAQNIFKRYPPPFRQMESRALARTSGLYPCSTEAGEVARAKGYAGELHVIPLGVDVPDAVTADRSGPVGFVGRIESYKGPNDALRAFAQATQSDRQFWFIGAGPEEANLKEMARDLGVDRRTVFQGAVSQARALEMIGRLSVLMVPSLITPSWKEQFGRVAAQAMAAGVPVIGYATGSLPEVVADAGELVDEGDVDCLAARLQRLLEDDDRWQTLSAQARERASGLFAWHEVADAFDRMYHAATTGRG